MSEKWLYVLLEIGLFILLGMLYYFYQKRKILKYETGKGPMLMGFVLESLLSERGDDADPQLDALIEALDDYLHNRTAAAPVALMKIYADSEKCSEELRNVIQSALAELA